MYEMKVWKIAVRHRKEQLKNCPINFKWVSPRGLKHPVDIKTTREVDKIHRKLFTHNKMMTKRVKCLFKKYDRFYFYRFRDERSPICAGAPLSGYWTPHSKKVYVKGRFIMRLYNSLY